LEWIIVGDWLFALVSYRLKFQPYRYPFRKPLQTFHGVWTHREGLLVGLQDEGGRIGWGEVAPIPWFGTETLEEAIAFCQALPSALSESDIFTIPDRLPACQFGLGSAWEAIPSTPAVLDFTAMTFCGLLPAGEAVCEAWSELWQKGYRTFKWKIGVLPIETELQLLKDLTTRLPGGTKLRLDANGGLSFEMAQRWLETCDSLGEMLCDRANPTNVEYLEQPLPPGQYQEMVQLTQAYCTPIALDESVATLGQLIRCSELGWTGVVVIKVAIAGYPHALRTFLRTHSVDAIFSSVFETEVGRNAALLLAQEFNNNNRAVGFGDWVLLVGDPS
jgi:o-succinylbenzoate synthase